MNYYSDYCSASSTDSNSPWAMDTWGAFQANLQMTTTTRPRSSSFTDKLPDTCSLEAKMKEFRMNGFDSPYDPDEERTLKTYPYNGMGPASGYLRQKSWPEPDMTPSVPLPRKTWEKPNAADVLLSVRPAEVIGEQKTVSSNNWKGITEEQIRVLNSVPTNVLYALLRELKDSCEKGVLGGKRQIQICRGDPRTGFKSTDQECRFCKNNGERELYYRSHTLRMRGRVVCPVLRAFICPRCGARGDRAHTLKYCPRATATERKQSAAMMRSVRMASGKLRNIPPPVYNSTFNDYVLFGETTSSVIKDGAAFANSETVPLDPIWEALVRKLQL